MAGYEHSGSSIPDPYCQCELCVTTIEGSFEEIIKLVEGTL